MEPLEKESNILKPLNRICLGGLVFNCKNHYRSRGCIHFENITLLQDFIKCNLKKGDKFLTITLCMTSSTITLDKMINLNVELSHIC